MIAYYLLALGLALSISLLGQSAHAQNASSAKTEENRIAPNTPTPAQLRPDFRVAAQARQFALAAQNDNPNPPAPAEPTPVKVNLRALRANLGDIKAAAILRADQPVPTPAEPARPAPLSGAEDRTPALMAAETQAWQARLERVDLSNATAATGADSVTLAPGDMFAAVRDISASAIELSDGTPAVLSSTVLYTPAPPGAAQPLRELGVAYSSAGLFWKSHAARFEGELLIGLVDRLDMHTSEDLSRPVPIQLLAAPGTLQRTDLQVQRIGLPYVPVAVNVDNPEDPFTVTLLSQIDPNLPAAQLTVKHPRVALTALKSIQGFGVEAATVTLNGVNTRLPAGLTLVLDLDHGWLADPTVVVGANGVASTRVRSTLVGNGTLRLATGPFVADPLVIDYRAPWPFLIATGFGSVLGASVLALRRRGGRRRRWIDWLIGCFGGIGFTAMAYAGMRLPEWVPVPAVLVGEVVPFALAFVCAMGAARLTAVYTGNQAA